MDKKPVTIKTIAKQFNVSPATVSKALRDSSDISEITKVKIKKIAKELGYKPNLMARNLVSKKSNIIGIILPEISTSFFGLIVKGINRSARNKSYETIIMVNDEHHYDEKKNLEFLTNLQVEGIIMDSVPGDNNLEFLKEISNQGTPIVFVDRRNDEIVADSVTTNDIKAGYSITKYFIDNGRKNIVFVGSVDDLSVAKERFIGYQKALKENNIEFDKNLVINNSVEINVQEIMDDVRKFIKSGVKFDGMICGGGLIAYNAGLALLEEGFNIPNDVFLGEFGDNNIVHRLGVPFVTVDQYPELIGEKALNLLIERIELKDSKASKENHLYIKSKLVHHFPAAHKHVFIEDI